MTAAMPIQYVKAKDLIEAELGDDLVGLDVGEGHCFGFNPVAADIWRLLDQPRDFEALRQALTDQYNVDPGECAAELRACLADLEMQGLVRAIQESP
jgi:hypothetical protein